MKCTNCRHDLPEGAIFCTQCGQVVQNNQENIHGNNWETENDQAINEEKDTSLVSEILSVSGEDKYVLNEEKNDRDKPTPISSGIRKWQMKWKETYTIFVLIGVLFLAAGGGLLYRSLRGRQGNNVGVVMAPNGEYGENLAGSKKEDVENPEGSKEKDEQEETKETECSVGTANATVEEDVNQIEKGYNEIISRVLEGAYSKIILRNGVVVYRDGPDVRSVVVSKGIDGNAY